MGNSIIPLVAGLGINMMVRSFCALSQGRTPFYGFQERNGLRGRYVCATPTQIGLIPRFGIQHEGSAKDARQEISRFKVFMPINLFPKIERHIGSDQSSDECASTARGDPVLFALTVDNHISRIITVRADSWRGDAGSTW